MMLASCLPAQTELSPNVRLQMAELLADKEARTPAQSKLDSHLIYGARMRRGQSITTHLAAMPMVMQSLKLRGELVHVDLNAEISDELAAAVRGAGGEVESAFPEYHAMRAWIPLLACERLAERADVHTIMLAAISHTASQPAKHPIPVKRPARPAGMLFSPLTPPPPAFPDQGGIVGHGADLVQAMGYIGAGVKVGVMSDGVDSLSSLQQQGYLPNNITVVTGQAGTGDEGTALMNVIYNMAPGVQMFFASGHATSSANMAANINTLVNTYHVNILVDDINWSDEGFFQDTNVSQAVANAAAAGVLCFTAAGNNNNLDSADAGTWVGDFANSGSTINLSGANYPLHDFGGGEVENPVGTQPGTQSPGLWFILQWSDPWACPTNNYDLFLVAGNNVQEAGTNQQNGCIGFPPEQYITQGYLGVSVVIAKAPNAAERALWLNTGRAVLGQYSDAAVMGHSGSVNEVSVAATEAFYTNDQTGGGARFTGGSANPIDLISSDGPRLMFFDPNGNLLNPGAASPYTIGGGGATMINKVDITAADGVNTAVPLYNPFGGTSAAAPHAAAIGALIKSADPYITNAHVVAAMKSTALVVTANNYSNGNLQLGQPNGVYSRTQGAGIAMADLAVGAVRPQVTFASVPTGVSITLAGSGCNAGTYSTPVTMKFLTDAVCTVTLNAPTIAGAAGGQQVFTSWSDSDTSNPKSITIGLGGPFTYTATYQQQYLLTTGVFPASSGSVAVLPTSTNGYYPVGAAVKVTATAANGYSFTQWTNDDSGTANPNWVTMGAPRTVTANFANPNVSGVSLTMMSQSALAGQTVQIPIEAAGSGTAVPSNVQFNLAFDTSKLTFSAAQASTALTGAGKSLAAQAVSSGVVQITSSGANQTTLPAGTVGYASFTLNPQFTSGGSLVSMASCSAANAQAGSLTTNCSTAVVEAGWCDVTGDASISPTDVAQVIKEALGISPPLHDLAHTGMVTVGAVQLVINAARGLGCPY
jgi:hypothetical protein